HAATQDLPSFPTRRSSDLTHHRHDQGIPMAQRPDSYLPRTRPDLAERIIDGEALIVNAHRGEIVVLNEAGAFLWPLLDGTHDVRSEEHTSELQSRRDLVCR